MTSPNKEWADRADSRTNDPERIERRRSMEPAFTVPRSKKKFSAELTIRNPLGTLATMKFESDTVEDLKHQIGQIQFLSFDGEVEARQKQWRIDNGIKAPKQG